MSRLATLFHVLTLLAGLLGLWGFYLMYRPGSPGELLGAVLHFVPLALFRLPVVVAGALAVAAGVTVRILDRRRPVDSKRRAYSLSVPALQRSPVRADGEGPAAFDPHQRDLLRLRLQGLVDGDMVSFVDELLAGAIVAGASDVHVQPLAGATRVSLRVEGTLEEVAAVAEVHHERIVRRLKVMARLLVYKSDEPQDGHFRLETPQGPVEMRISILPTQHGEKVVLRLARGSGELRELAALGMAPELRAAYEEVLRQPQGLVLLTGPTGSGKTTTIYSSLAHIHAERGRTTNVASIEDPVEVEMPFVSQTQVERGRGLDFAKGLRAVLRQDPNVLMIGEIRDPETAEIAVQAGLTGHLILTTLHSESTAGVFARLIDVGVEPFLVASSTLACVSQRLVPRLCGECRRPHRPARSVTSELVRRGFDTHGVELYKSEGCAACGRTGVAGRTAIYEMLRMTPALRQAIASKVPTSEIEKQAVADGMRPIFHTAMAEAAAGRLSVEEVLRVLG